MARSSAEPHTTPTPRLSGGIWRLPLRWFWPLFWSGLMVGSGVFGVWALAWLTRIPPLPDCEEITRFSSDSDRLLCAQAQMQSASPRDLVLAVQLLHGWPQEHPLYEDALPVLTEVSDRLLARATEQMHRGNLAYAIELASAIPPETPLRPTAQAAIWNWQQDWAQGEAITEATQNAIDNRDWESAEKSAQQLKTLASDYWLENRYGELQQVITREKTAWSQLDTARALAATGNPENLGQALLLAQRVDLNSQAWADAEADIDLWSHNLLLYSFQRWEVGDIAGAVAAVQKVPPDPNLVPEARDLIQFSHAHRLADNAQQDQPSYLQLFYLMEAIRAAADISPGSPFYGTAQASRKNWQAQLEDLQKIQFAHVVAGLGQPWAFRYAGQVARQVDLKRPRRIQAQTLIAHWQGEIERIEDRPYLLRADRLARGGTIAALKLAIAEARRIDLGRALRVDAQTRIADWLVQIEVIQDQPILTAANALASAGKLVEAIKTAEQITADRALYDQAQAMVKDWTRTIQIKEDGPILEKAKSRAYEGYLTEAIVIAAQISPGRALYREAQTAIALWEAERKYIWSLEAEATDAADGANPSGTDAESDGFAPPSPPSNER